MKTPLPMIRRTRSTQLGMALMECLMAMLIFSFGLLGLIGLEARAINFSVDAEDRNRASIFAGEVASNMWINNTVAPTTAAYAALLTTVNDQTRGGLPNGAVTVVAVAGTTNAADITVTWKPPSDLATDQTSVLTTRVILP